jgi:hypothetical protein
VIDVLTIIWLFQRRDIMTKKMEEIVPSVTSLLMKVQDAELT